jgi:hypothetical protein
MRMSSEIVVGVDACPVGWVATVIEDGNIRIETYETFRELKELYSNAARIESKKNLSSPQSWQLSRI